MAYINELRKILNTTDDGKEYCIPCNRYMAYSGQYKDTFSPDFLTYVSSMYQILSSITSNPAHIQSSMRKFAEHTKSLNVKKDDAATLNVLSKDVHMILDNATNSLNFTYETYTNCVDFYKTFDKDCPCCRDCNFTDYAQHPELALNTHIESEETVLLYFLSNENNYKQLAEPLIQVKDRLFKCQLDFHSGFPANPPFEPLMVSVYSLFVETLIQNSELANRLFYTLPNDDESLEQLQTSLFSVFSKYHGDDRFIELDKRLMYPISTFLRSFIGTASVSYSEMCTAAEEIMGGESEILKVGSPVLPVSSLPLSSNAVKEKMNPGTNTDEKTFSADINTGFSEPQNDIEDLRYEMNENFYPDEEDLPDIPQPYMEETSENTPNPEKDTQGTNYFNEKTHDSNKIKDETTDTKETTDTAKSVLPGVQTSLANPEPQLPSKVDTQAAEKTDIKPQKTTKSWAKKVTSLSKNDYIIDNHFPEILSTATDLGDPVEFMYFESQVLTNKFIVLEAIKDSENNDYLLFYNRQQKLFYYISLTNKKVMSVLTQYLTANSFTKICYQPYHLYACGRKYNIKIKRVFSILTCYSFLNHASEIKDYEYTINSFLPLPGRKLSDYISKTQNAYMLCAGMMEYAGICAACNRKLKEINKLEEMSKIVDLDEALGRSYYIEDLYENISHPAFRLVGPNDYRFREDTCPVTIVDGRFFDYSLLESISQEDGRRIIRNVLYYLVEAGRFRQHKIYIVSFSEMNLKLFIPEYYSDYYETLLMTLFNKSSKDIIGSDTKKRFKLILREVKSSTYKKSPTKEEEEATQIKEFKEDSFDSGLKSEWQQVE